MITVEEAKGIIDSNLIQYSRQSIPYDQSVGHILDEDLTADRDFPPFHRVTMDGIAINFSSWTGGKRAFRVENMAPAGSPSIALINPENCIEVMTGAMLPENTNCVIRYEDVEFSQEDNNRKIARITVDSITQNQNIHGKGIDRKSGDVLMKSGTLISPPDIGVITTIGKQSVSVRILGPVAIIATGDELVNVNQRPEAHQIRMSNVFAIKSALDQRKIQCQVMHLKDDKDVLRSKLEEIFQQFPIIILSGGVSKGKFDFVPEILEELGIKKLFHRIAQRPGKPFWFGRSDSNVVFALPGNPVSAFMCYNQYFIPWFYKCLGYELRVQNAELEEPFEFIPDLTYFLQVQLRSGNDGKLYATPLAGHGSGDHANLLDTDAFLILPRGKNLFEKGEVYPFIPFR